MRILSGVFEGATTGTPIALLIENVDAKSRDYSKIKDVFRPAHADYTYLAKYGVRDYRGGGRASARETAVRVAAAAIAKKYLRDRFGCTVRGWLAQLGPLRPARVDLDEVDRNPFFSPDPDLVPDLERFMDALRKEGDSIGARVTVRAAGVPRGLGEPVYGEARRRARVGPHGDQRGEGGRNRVRVRLGRAEGDRAPRRDHPGGVPLQQCGRDPGRHLHRPGHRRRVSPSSPPRASASRGGASTGRGSRPRW